MWIAHDKLRIVVILLEVGRGDGFEKVDEDLELHGEWRVKSEDKTRLAPRFLSGELAEIYAS